jgi:hypothetical protein
MADKKGRLFADACFPIPIVHALRRLGYHVETVQRLEGTSRPDDPLQDESVLEAAIRFHGAILTLDNDYRQIHYKIHQTHKGIIICSETFDFEKRAKEIDDRIQMEKPLIGKLIYVTSKKD